MGQKKGKNEMYDDIMDDINNKAAEDANRMVFFGPDVTAQALLFFQGRISDAPEGTDYPPPPRVMLNPEFQGRSFNEIAEALDRYLEVFKKMEEEELRSAVYSVTAGDAPDYREVITMLVAASDDDEEIPDEIEIWAPYENSSPQWILNKIDEVYEYKRRRMMRIVNLVCEARN